MDGIRLNSIPKHEWKVSLFPDFFRRAIGLACSVQKGSCDRMGIIYLPIPLLLSPFDFIRSFFKPTNSLFLYPAWVSRPGHPFFSIEFQRTIQPPISYRIRSVLAPDLPYSIEAEAGQPTSH